MIRIVKILLLLLVADKALAQGNTLQLNCTSLENPSTLTISLSRPTMREDCDVNDDCGQTSGSYTLTSDLTNPHAPLGPSDSRDRYVDTYIEGESGGLNIEQAEDFSIQFSPGFREELANSGRVAVTVTSFVTEGGANGTFQLYCKQ